MSTLFKEKQSIVNLGTEDEMVFMELSVVKQGLSRHTKRLILRVIRIVSLSLLGTAIILFGEPAWSTLLGFILLVIGIDPIRLVNQIMPEEVIGEVRAAKAEMESEDK